MIPVFAHPELAAQMQDAVRRAMEAEIAGVMVARPDASCPARPVVVTRTISATSRTGRALRLMQRAPDFRFTVRQLADALGCKSKDLTWALAHLTARGDIARAGRNAHGRILYRAICSESGGGAA